MIRTVLKNGGSFHGELAVSHNQMGQQLWLVSGDLPKKTNPLKHIETWKWMAVWYCFVFFQAW